MVLEWFEYFLTWLIISKRWPKPPGWPPESISICASDVWSFTETTSTLDPVSPLSPSSNEVNTSDTSDEAIVRTNTDYFWVHPVYVLDVNQSFDEFFITDTPWKRDFLYHRLKLWLTLILASTIDVAIVDFLPVNLCTNILVHFVLQLV